MLLLETKVVFQNHEAAQDHREVPLVQEKVAPEALAVPVKEEGRE